MRIFIDCDGVLLDTENGLFNKYYEMKENGSDISKTQYLQEMDWESWINQADILGNSIEILRKYPITDINILTKVHSLKEATAKVNFFRKLRVRNNIIIVPDELSKNMVVDARKSILIDDNNTNLEEWNNSGGIPIYFGDKESNFYKVKSIEDIINGAKFNEIVDYYRNYGIDM